MATLKLLFLFGLTTAPTTEGLPWVYGSRAEREAAVQTYGPDLYDAKVPNGEKPKTLELEGNKGNWFILRQLLTFEEAEQACEAEEGAHLAVLPTLEMAKSLVESIQRVSSPSAVIEDPENAQNKKVMEIGSSREYWIGLTDAMEEGQWSWLTVGRDLEYDFWYPGQPSHNLKTNGQREHCGSLWNPGYYMAERNTHTFNDATCTKKFYAICDKTNDLKSLFAED